MWASRSKCPKPPTPSTPAPLRNPLSRDLPPPGEGGDRVQPATTLTARTLSLPLPNPIPTATCSPAAPYPQDRTDMGSPEETGQGDGETQREVTGQGRLRSPKLVQSAEGGKGKERKGKESLWLLEAPVRRIILQMHTRARTSQCWSRQTQRRFGVCIWMHRVNGTGNRPSPTPGVVKQNKSSRGSVDTTKTRSDPQRVRMCKGKRPIGTAKGKQTNTMTSCQPPPPPPLKV